MAPVSEQRREMLDLLGAAAEPRGIEVETFSQGWVIRLRRNGRTRYAVGNDFDLNRSAAAAIADDKVATSLVLEACAVPAVEHVLFTSPALEEWHEPEGMWTALSRYAADHGHAVVAKPVRGSGGRSVLRVSNQRELEAAAQELLERDRDFCLSPYLEIEAEHRVVVVDDRPLIRYRKQVPEVVGDGTHTVGYLARHQLNTTAVTRLVEELSTEQLSTVPDAGEVVRLGWRHNLGQGARPIEVDAEAAGPLDSLASEAMRALGLRCGAVDIVEDAAGERRVLEVNSGVMLTGYAASADERRAAAVDVYGAILDAMFGEAEPGDRR